MVRGEEILLLLMGALFSPTVAREEQRTLRMGSAVLQQTVWVITRSLLVVMVLMWLRPMVAAEAGQADLMVPVLLGLPVVRAGRVIMEAVELGEYLPQLVVMAEQAFLAAVAAEAVILALVGQEECSVERVAVETFVLMLAE